MHPILVHIGIGTYYFRYILHPLLIHIGIGTYCYWYILGAFTPYWYILVHAPLIGTYCSKFPLHDIIKAQMMLKLSPIA